MYRMSLMMLLPLLGCQGGGAGMGIPSGQWDFSFTGSGYSRGAVNVAAPNALLTLVKTDQGKNITPTCQRTTSQMEIALTVNAGQGNGSATWISQHQGSGCSAADLMMRRDLITSFTIQRTAGTGTGLDNPEGTWELKGTRSRDVGHLKYTAGRVSGDFQMRSNYSFSGSVMDRVVQGLDTHGAQLMGAER